MVYKSSRKDFLDRWHSIKNAKVFLLKMNKRLDNMDKIPEFLRDKRKELTLSIISDIKEGLKLFKSEE